MQDAGFVNIHVEEFKLPLSPWMEDHRLKEAGAFAMISMLDEIGGMSAASFTRFLGWELDRLEIFLAIVKKEWRTKGIHSYWPL